MDEARAWPAWAQLAAFRALGAWSRARAWRRVELPPFGEATYLTAVLRLGIEPPAMELADHYMYPAAAIHVTVCNLDEATVDVGHGCAALRTTGPIAFDVRGLGAGPTTQYLRCIHHGEFAQLRRAVRAAFGVPAPRSIVARLYEHLSFANVARFDGRPRYRRVHVPHATVVCREMQIVRTDRFLSDEGTTVLARIAL